MYLEFFGLNEPPFNIAPQTAFFYTGSTRGTTLNALIYAITHDEGIVKVNGDVGSGKTLLCRLLMERLPSHYITIYLSNPSASGDDILHAIIGELGIDVTASRTSALLRTLQETLIKLYCEDRQIVVLIDDAHAMPAETLEQVRMLSNLESNHHKLLHLLLVGQPELNEMLARPDMRQLKERITHNFSLEPLRHEDIAAFLDFRMRAAGYRGVSIFSEATIKLITQASLGLIRRIIILADKSLLAAFAENSRQIGTQHVRSAIRDSQFGDYGISGIARHKLLVGSMAGAFLTALAVTATYSFWPKTGETPPPHPPVAKQASGAIGAPAAAPVKLPPPPVETQAPAPVQSPPPPVATQAPAPAQSPPAVQADANPPAVASSQKYGNLTQARIEATQQWLASVPDDHWFIQLLGSDARQAIGVENYLSRIINLLGADQVRVYVVDKPGQRRLGVIYGDYPTQEAAYAAVQQLPAEIRKANPFPRQVKRLR